MLQQSSSMLRSKQLIFLLSLIAILSSQNIRLATVSLNSSCQSNDDCQYGYFCNNDLVCQDKCAMMKCTSSTICKEGECHPICDDKVPCPTGQFCNSGYCLDKCRYTKCASGYSCELGKCIKKECQVDKDCKTGFYCTSEWKCQDKCKIENYCKSDQTCQKGVCKTSVTVNTTVCPKMITCTDPRPDQKTCPTLYFFRKPDPVVCGVTSDGTLVDYEVECYACKNKTIAYYFNTTCDKIPKDCLTPNVSTNSSLPSEIKCTNPRPTQKTCPILTWIRQPDPIVCGISKHGEYIDFPVQCYACRQKNIVFYYNKTCKQVKKIAETLTCEQVSCGVGFVCKNGKCIQTPSSKKINCTAPRPTEKDCPTINFIKKPDPLVCGVTKNGSYVDFPIQCYACKSSNIIYYYNTTCDQIPQAKCAAVQCKKGDKCVDGICTPTKWPVCQQNVMKQQCGKDRPTQANCPLLYFLQPPPYNACGVTSTGERINYHIECYACKNTDVVYYYNNSCEKLSAPCEVKASECSRDKDCSNNLSCVDNMCIDKCIVTTCPTGTQCIKGSCVWSHLKQKNCSQIKCRQGFKCEDGHCIDLCKNVTCDDGDTCVSGECVPIIIGDCATLLCEKGKKCECGECVDLCKDVFCIATHSCVDGKCVPIKV